MYPILFTIPKIGGFGPFPIHTFGVIMVIAFASALWVMRRRAARFGVDPSKIMDAGFWALVSGVLGARIAFILQDLPYFLSHTEDLFTLQFQGLTSFGGLIFAVIALAIWSKREGIPIQRMFDIAAPAYAVGHIIGRIGCLMNGCCYGGVCDPNFFLATHFNGRPEPHHPAQIYDALMNVAALGGFFALEKRGLRMGQAAAFMLAAHGLARFIYEFWRAGTPEEVKAQLASSTRIGSLPITEAQVMAAALIVTGIVWFVLARKNRSEFEPLAAPEPVPAVEQELQPA
jgi:phosphatidylglycerol:prolipoprotein diacylglycerol transferase